MGPRPSWTLLVLISRWWRRSLPLIQPNLILRYQEVPMTTGLGLPHNERPESPFMRGPAETGHWWLS